MAEDASSAVGESQSAFSAILTIGDERLHRLGADVGALDELTEATDAAIADLQAEAASPATLEVVESVRGLIERSRSSEVMDAQALLGTAADELLHLDFADADAYPTSESRNAAVVNHHAVESLQLREWAWIAYLTTEQVDPTSISVLSADFATAKFAINQTQIIDAQGGSTRIQQVLQSPAGVRLTELEVEAIDDLAEEQLSVSTPVILGALADFRTEWGATVRGQTSALRGAVDDELVAANDLRSLFTLLAVLGVVVLLGLIFVIYRSITLPLGSLLDRASSVANEELPDLVEALRNDDGSADLPTADPIPITTDDEIGELVAAFNDVQATAYDLATEQALGRRNVADMFVNLGRRNQQLLQRILAQLTQLEQNEEDPDKLSDLFELDNIVTRMRRNAESLLALAGAQTARQWSQPIAIDNAVRAAFGEVEGYERIDITDLADVKVTGSVVADITHLLAELLENSINFSEPHTSVEVTGRIGNDGYHVIVEDRGIGMSARELMQNNSRISDPPPLDQVPTRFLGLYVVGRLAERHNIQVKLTETSAGGISAKVTLPPSLLVTEEDERKKQAGVVEVETSPLEEEHDLDAELASITEAIDSEDETSNDQVEGELAEDSADEDSLNTEPADEASAKHDLADDDDDSHLPSIVDSDGDSDKLPTRPIKSAAATAVAEPATETEALPVRGDRTARKAKTRKTDRAESADELAEVESVEAEAPAEPVAEAPVVDGGLPVRNKGGALEQAKPIVERVTVEDRAPTDTSPEAAGSFSTMMSALSSGVARGLEDSEFDESTEGNDK